MTELTGDTLISVADGRELISVEQLANEGKIVNINCLDLSNKLQIRQLVNIQKLPYTHTVLKLTLAGGMILRVSSEQDCITSSNKIKLAYTLTLGESLKSVLLNSKSSLVHGSQIVKIENVGLEPVYDCFVAEYRNLLVGGKSLSSVDRVFVNLRS